MKLTGSVLAIAAASVLLTGASLLGCSKSTSPTSPSTGGLPGGGGSGDTPFDSGSLTAPATFVRVFPTAATVGYHCTFHANMGMTGTVTVVSGAADSAVVSASGISFVPASVSIRPGGHVRWNVTGGTHTVTSN
jgi:plastocyanin